MNVSQKNLQELMKTGNGFYIEIEWVKAWYTRKIKVEVLFIEKIGIFKYLHFFNSITMALQLRE